MRVGQPAEQPAAEWSHEEPHGEDGGGGQKLTYIVSGRKECRSEVDRRVGIGKKVEPLDEVAGACADDGLDLMTVAARQRRRRTGQRNGLGHGVSSLSDVAP